MRSGTGGDADLSMTGSGGFDVYDNVQRNGSAVLYGSCSFLGATTCAVDVPLGATVLIVASSAQNGTTTGWGGDCATVGTVNGRTGTCLLTMNDAKSASATFTPNP